MTAQTPEITLETFAARRGDGVTVDVREKIEYAYGWVPGAILIPMGHLASSLGELDGSKPIHVICTTGSRSKAMADLLVAAGFGAAFVAGGTQGWMVSGQPVEVGL